MTRDVKEYEFHSFSQKPLNSSVEEFEFQDFEGMSIREIEEKQKIIRVERELAKDTGFDLNPIVHEHRGVRAQEESDFTQAVHEEVARQIEAIKEDAYREGLELGREQGREEVKVELAGAAEEKILLLNDMVSEVLSTQVGLLSAQKMQTYTLLRTIAKWIVLKELKDDGEYIIRLLEKLIVEAQTKENLLIRVNEKHFEQMPEVLEVVQGKLGELTNTRVEIDYDIEAPGIVVESQNGIVNGSLKTQLDSLDKLFEAVGLASSEDDSDESQ
ncbi:FliH/SctL family protein [Halobacteriovorax sp. HFRX-2_2]|uniref:FliH/SctL family protein n=1 Tax=unclassified Halobacteriovorax TaxID=2639665 RepID=UPI0037104556